MENPTPSLSTVYQRLFARCPTLAFPGLWNFVGSSGDCRGCIVDPAETVAALRAEFELPLLQSAGVVACLPDGDWCLPRHVCDPAGAIIALRAEAAEAPFELLTAAGCLSGRTVPLLATLDDARTVEQTKQSGYLFASFHIQEVALLRALGFAATLATGMQALSFDQLCSLDTVYGEGTLRTGVEPARSAPPPTGDAAAESAPSGHATTQGVILVGWNLLQLDAAAPPELAEVAARFEEFGRFLDYFYWWLGIWRVPTAYVETLRYRLQFQTLALIAPLLATYHDYHYELCSARAQVQMVEPEACRPPTDLAEAQTNLVAKLAVSRNDRYREAEAREAKQAYEDIVRRDLVRPLQEWALASKDLLVRAAGVELANICALLHEMGPSLQGLVGDPISSPRAADPASTAKLFARYLQLSARFAGLLKTLWHMSKAPRWTR